MFREALIKSRDARCVRCGWMQGVAAQPRYLGKPRNEADAAAEATRSSCTSFEGPERFCADEATCCRWKWRSAIDTRHKSAPVAHVRLDQCFPRYRSWP